MNSHHVKEIMTRAGIGEDQFRTLGLLPLIEVAWADGRVQFSERSTLMRFARRKGWLSDGGDALVETWMKKRPSDGMFEEARRALAALVRDRRGMGSAFPEDTLGAVLCACRDIAASSGQLFGFRNPIVAEEDQALQRIADVFELGPWREAVAQVEAVPVAERSGPAGHFLLGSLPEFSKDALDFITSTMREHGDVVPVKLGPMDTVFLSHPDHIKRVYMDNYRNYRVLPIEEGLKEYFGAGLVSTDGEQWRTHRRIMQPAFHMEKLAAMADTMTRITDADLSRWHDAERPREPVDLMDKFMQLTLRVAGVCMFGMDLRDDMTAVLDAAETWLEFVTDRVFQIIRLPLSIPTEQNRRFIQASSVLDRVVRGLAAARRQGKSAEKPDVLQFLLDARDEDTGRGLDEQEVRDELLTMMLAGTETTALALMWTCAFLSKYPATRRAAEEEVRRVLGDRVPTLADVRNMPFLKQVIDESMRLRPPVYAGARMAVGEDVIGGVTIKPGSMVYTPIYAMHRHPDFWPNPEGFDPERFSPEASKDRPAHAFLPFGIGPKKCIGASFAMMEMQLVLPMVLQRFEMHLLPGLEPEPSPKVTLRAKDGCWVTLHPKK